MVNNEIVARISEKIRAIRLKKNLTIAEVAERTRVTKGLLSKIENARTIPSLPVFVQIIQSLDISMKEFFEDMVLTNGNNYLLIKRNQYAKMEREGREGFGYKYIFSQAIPTSTVEIVLLTIAPGATGRPSVTDGYEFKHLISGSCQYRINNEVIEMQEGDSIYFDASVPHIPMNTSDKEAVMIVVYFIVPKS